jgi:hypothetical protein
MAKGHTYFWRKPGRRDEERKKFSALMRKVEAVRLRYGISKTELGRRIRDYDRCASQLDDGKSHRAAGDGR